MSLNSAIVSALSGINASARATKLVADNIANAGTASYGVRSLQLGAAVTGHTGNGVAIHGVSRMVDMALVSELRGANAARGHAHTLQNFWSQMETGIGLPDEAGSLNARLTTFEAALRHAVAQPEADSALAQIAFSANAVVEKLHGVQAQLIHQRDNADRAIATDVDALNAMLQQTADLNAQIQRQTLLGGAPEALMDQRQSVIDAISELISIREIQRDDGKVMLLGADGTILVDDRAAEFGFTRRINPQPSDTLASGALSQLTLHGTPLDGANAMLAQGRIGANFVIRDQDGPALQNQLDQFTADLLTRFSGPDTDPSLAAGELGLFTLISDNVLPADITGISAHIRINPQIDSTDPATLWRLRSGLNAATPGPVGMTDTLNGLYQALVSTQTMQGGSSAQNSNGHAADLASKAGTNRFTLQSELAFHQTRESALRESLAAQGVDTDAQLQKLLSLEQAYAANARVLTTVDAMLRRLMEI